MTEGSELIPPSPLPKKDYATQENENLILLVAYFNLNLLWPNTVFTYWNLYKLETNSEEVFKRQFHDSPLFQRIWRQSTVWRPYARQTNQSHAISAAVSQEIRTECT